MPISSTKSMSNFFAGFLASGKDVGLMIVPTRISSFIKSSILAILIEPLFYMFTHFYAALCSFLLLELLEDHINIPIPSIKRKIPNQEVVPRFSPNMNTPNNAAVNGSTKASVTAVDDDTWLRPVAKSKYATPDDIS